MEDCMKNIYIYNGCTPFRAQVVEAELVNGPQSVGSD